MASYLGVRSLSGPPERFSGNAVKKMSKLLLTAGERATLALGGSGRACKRAQRESLGV